MDKYDTLISDALSEQDRQLLAGFQEQGYLRLALGLFQGRNGWVTGVMVTTFTVMFFAAIWCGWQFFAATNMLAALKWGLSGVSLLTLSMQLKMALIPQIQADRVLLALRRLELRLGAQG